jgi:hypothetical protein
MRQLSPQGITTAFLELASRAVSEPAQAAGTGSGSRHGTARSRARFVLGAGLRIGEEHLA